MQFENYIDADLLKNLSLEIMAMRWRFFTMPFRRNGELQECLRNLRLTVADIKKQEETNLPFRKI